MATAALCDLARGAVRPRTERRDDWSEAGLREADLRRAVDQLFERVCPNTSRLERRAAVEAIVRLGLEPEMHRALHGRRDGGIALRDLATRYAFEMLIEQGKAIHQLDPLSQALIQGALDLIYERAAQVAARLGENPLDEDHGLLLSICKSLARYVPLKPMSAHIWWKLNHYEGAASRAMRQVENLVRHPEVTEAFVAFALEADAPDVLKAHLLNLARGGGRTDLPYNDVIRFFAQPGTVAFVKQFAATVQTARTLYAEEEYAGIPWLGKRRLPANRRQGYLDLALARVRQADDVSLDSADVEFHALLPCVSTDAGGQDEPGAGLASLRCESFERWVTRQALAARPDDPLWQAAGLLYDQGLRPEEAVARGLAEAQTLAEARARVEALQADPDVWEAWMAATLG